MLAAFVLAALLAGPARPASDKPIVYFATIEGTIDLGLAPFVERVLAEAEREGAEAVVLDMDTFGGRLDAAVAIRDSLLDSPVTTVAFVRKRAISAGALIALASSTLVMADGSTIGAATPVQLHPTGDRNATDEKTISYVRKEFRATAERRGRSLAIAEAMVDPAVEVPDLVPAGKLLTLTAEEATEHGVADLRANDIDTVLERLGLRGAEVRPMSPLWAERFVRLVTDPVLASLLMTLGMLGLIVEIRTPGFGAPGVVGVLSLALFFWGHWIAKLAGFEELALVIAGLLLLGVEFFLFPGFGIAGVLGILALVGGLGWSLMGSGVSASAVTAALGRTLLSVVVATAVLIALLPVLARFRTVPGIVLETSAPAPDADRIGHEPLPGRRGVALSPLRPAGVASFSGHRTDVVSDGSFVEAGEAIEVVQQDGGRVVVRRVAPHQATEERDDAG